MANSIITISREFGTGARTIGQKLAADLGFAYYDRAIIQLAAEKSGLSPEFIERNEEKSRKNFLFNLANTAYVSSGINLQYTMPANDRAFIAQSEVIKDIANREDCIIVGRCADYVLQDYPNVLRVFILADHADRVKRIVEEYGYDAKNAEDELNKIDKGRASYHKFYTGTPWKDMNNYDLCINTSKTGIDGAVAVLRQFIDIALKK